MAGSTEVGPNYSDGSIFEDSRWVITPTKNTPQHAIKTILSLIEAMGAEPMFMDANEHDSYVAAISHMPLFAQIALFALAKDSNAWAELSMLASSGFKSASRLVGTNPSLAFDINETNQVNIVHWIERYMEDVFSACRAKILQCQIDEAGMRHFPEVLVLVFCRTLLIFL